MSDTDRPWVIVVGAGPAGLLLSVMLAKLAGIKVQVLEANSKLDVSLRAAYYGPPAAVELRRAGLLDEIRREGFQPEIFCWRKLDGSYIAGLDYRKVADNPDRLFVLPLDQLGALLYRHASTTPGVEISFNHKVTEVGQDKDDAWVQVETSTGLHRLQAKYVVGCDGASSTVRRFISEDGGFPGFTWDNQIMTANVRLLRDPTPFICLNPDFRSWLTWEKILYPFDKFGYSDVQFIIHSEHWHLLARLSKNPNPDDDVWRIAYGEISGLTKEELLARQPEKFSVLLPGNPQPEDYKILSINPYKTHQRLVDSMRKGRLLLAADAAHLCPPFGGLGLTGGIVDVGGLYDCLAGIYHEKAEESILDLYSEVRRQKYIDHTDPMTKANLRRLTELDPDRALEDDKFLKLLDEIKNNNLEAQKEILMGDMKLYYDFTQHYKDKTPIVKRA
ncbi:hypothetical protein H2200_001495 [Cladophialophora chaetospira]|uniref:FAD-binding domain-containing protein n=1 Tax=Cladophialophora chaetospira TaxID=386627 RepID=A0AA38XL99_9EURO|nr:hypothetical protein H2200_001495 [Cladophialophora chaetospira]